MTMMAPVTAKTPIADDLYDAIGAFLRVHRLSPDPAHYAFAYQVVADPNGIVATAVASITDGGVRLRRHDIESLGGEVSTGKPVDGEDDDEQATGAAHGIAARAQMQVDQFADLMQAIQAETRDFGRDLEASAAEMAAVGGERTIDQIANLTVAMLGRVRDADSRLEAANAEVDALREALDDALGNARLDPLTGLPNRRAFDEAFADDRSEQACIAICDVDHFKSVNDRYGHAVGDRVLKAIGQTLGENCLAHFVARYGGEEFAVLFRGVDVATAQTILEQAREAVAAKRFRLRETDEPLGAVTLSAGIAAVIPREIFGAAYGRADRALYEAKVGGRNCVAVAPDIGSSR